MLIEQKLSWLAYMYIKMTQNFQMSIDVNFVYVHVPYGKQNAQSQTIHFPMIILSFNFWGFIGVWKKLALQKNYKTRVSELLSYQPPNKAHCKNIFYIFYILMYSCRTSKVYKLLLIRTLHRKKSIFFQIWKWKSGVSPFIPYFECS